MYKSTNQNNVFRPFSTNIYDMKILYSLNSEGSSILKKRRVAKIEIKKPRRMEIMWPLMYSVQYYIILTFFFSECPMTEDNVEMLACPTPDIWNRIHCIHYYSLCDRKINCPNAEDEDPTMCLFHSVVSISLHLHYENKPIQIYRKFYHQKK